LINCETTGSFPIPQRRNVYRSRSGMLAGWGKSRCRSLPPAAIDFSGREAFEKQSLRFASTSLNARAGCGVVSAAFAAE
jgi:hypothetical protein